MREDERASAVCGRNNHWRNAIVIATIVLVFAIIVSVTVIKHHANVGLPQSIDQYREALHQPDFGMYFLDFSHALLPTPNNDLTLDNAKLHLDELLGRRHANMGSAESIGNLVADYSAVARKRISFGSSPREISLFFRTMFSILSLFASAS